MSLETVKANTKTASPIKDITDASILEEIALILCVIEDFGVV
ncbi:MAG: hypothetical protein ACXV2B_06150 [Halobacteriota archaeon]